MAENRDDSSANSREVLKKLLLEKLKQEKTASERPPEIMVDPSQRGQPFPLTDIQRAYWLGRKPGLTLGNIACHCYSEFETSTLDPERLGRAWLEVIRRHDMLRAVVTPDGENQIILSEVPPYTFEILDATDGQRAEEIIQKTRSELSHKTRSGHEWPLFDLKFARLPGGRLRIFFGIDLLTIDATGMFRVFDEWGKIYSGAAGEGKRTNLSFRDYVLHDERLRAKGEGSRAAAWKYWRDRLGSIPEGPKLPLRKHPSEVARPHFVRHCDRLEERHWKKLKQKARELGLTPTGLIQAAYAEVLSYYSNQSRFTILMTVFNRQPLHPEVNDLIGDFTTTNLLEVDGTGATFIDRAKAIQSRLWMDLEQNAVTGTEVLREYNRTHRTGSVNRMPVVLTSTLGEQSVDDPWGWLGTLKFGVNTTPQIWIDHQVKESRGELIFNWDVVEELFPENLISDAFASYCRLLRNLAEHEELWMASRFELQMRMADREPRSAPNPSAITTFLDTHLHALFSAAEAQYPDRVAIVDGEERITYCQLGSFARRLAHQLQELGAKPNQLIPIVLEKGWHQIGSALAILYSGAAYMPIDPKLPASRQAWLVDNSDAKIVITHRKHLDALGPVQTRAIICLDESESDLAQRPDAPIAPVQSTDDLAYVIFTSGSTGFPKGVMISHRSAINTVLDINQRFRVGPDDSAFFVSSLSFDLSVYDIFGLLAVGGRIVIPKSPQPDPKEWVRLVRANRVTIWNSVPILCGMLVGAQGLQPKDLESLRVVLLSGDWIPLDLPEQIRQASPAEIISLGGATEASIWSIIFPIHDIKPDWRSIPYGKALTNQKMMVLNSDFCNCPNWVEGEIYIGGVGIAQGYWKNAEETRKRFLVHSQTGEKIYRTGDGGRMLPSGDIEILGRLDSQVKVKGHRIELGEIEYVLKQHAMISDAVASTFKAADNDTKLAGYVMGRFQASPDVKQMKLDYFSDCTIATGSETLHLEIVDIETAARPILWSDLGDEEGTLVARREGLSEPLQIAVKFRRRGAEVTAVSLLETVPIKFSLKAQGIRPSLVDLRKVDLRVVVNVPAKARADGKELDCTLCDISRSGGRLRNMPDGEYQGDEVVVEWVGSNGTIQVDGKVIWRQSGFWGIKFNSETPGLELARQFLQERLAGLAAVSAEELRAHCEKYLPPYMVPSYYVILDRIPLNANGKVDRSQLPVPSRAPRGISGISELRSETERRLAAVWAKLLDISESSLSVETSFFELGGDSLLLIRLAKELSSALSREVSVGDLFEHQSIRQFAKFAESAQKPGENVMEERKVRFDDLAKRRRKAA